MHQHTQQPVCNESWDEISNQETKQKASTLTLKLPWVTKTEFLFTTSIQYQPDSDENKEKY